MSGYDVGNGGLERSKGVSAANKYINNLGYKASSFDYWSDPFSYFVNDIGKNYTVLTSIRSGSEGHLVIVIGWGEDRCSNSGRFLRVIDGWTTHTNRYVKFDNYYKEIRGTRWNIK